MTSSSLLYSQCFGWCILQVFHVEFGRLHGTLNGTLYLLSIDCSNSVDHNWIQEFSYSKYSSLFMCSQHWICNLYMILLQSSLTKTPTSVIPYVLLDEGHISRKVMNIKIKMKTTVQINWINKSKFPKQIMGLPCLDSRLDVYTSTVYNIKSLLKHKENLIRHLMTILKEDFAWCFEK